MPSLPLISLVTPSYNQAAFLGAALDSVKSQNYPRLEHVVVDGGSTDGSAALLAARQADFTWWCSERDSGLYAALNKGFAHTTGEVMGWLNSDDLLLPGALATVGAIFAAFPKLDWLSSLSLSTWNAAGHCTGTSTIEGYARTAFLDGGYLPGRRRHYGWIPQESTFWRRSLWETAGARLDAAQKLAGDFNLWSRFYRHAELVGTTAPLGGFRTHGTQKSRAMEEYLREARQSLEVARHTLHHRPSLRRRFLQRSRLADVPGLRGPLARACGHRALRVVADAEDGWRLESYSFL